MEALEALKLVAYDNKNLALTPKGQKVFERVHADLEPYINIKGVLTSDDIAKFTTRTQTILKGD